IPAVDRLGDQGLVVAAALRTPCGLLLSPLVAPLVVFLVLVVLEFVRLVLLQRLHLRLGLFSVLDRRVHREDGAGAGRLVSAGEIRRHIVVEFGGVLHQQVNVRQIGERGELGRLRLLLRRLGGFGRFGRRFWARGARRGYL